MRDMRALIHRLADQGITIILSSHLMAEVEGLCNRVAIIQSGKIIYEGEIAALKRSAGASYSLQTTDDAKALKVCEAQPGVEDVRIQQDRIWFTASEDTVAKLSQALVEAGALIRSLTPQTASLEELFFSLTEGADGHGTATPPTEQRVEAAT
jgi:ABC-2 type transport system ATP-binding protein